MRRLRGALCLAAILGVLGTAAQAQVVTIDGTDFNVTYNESDLGLFGTLNLVGDNLFFTPNNFLADSVNGQGAVATDSTASGIIITAHPGFTFGTLSLSEFGDYLLQGPGSSVSVAGELVAFDYNNPFTTVTQVDQVTNPALPLTINDGTTHNWETSAVINNSSTPTTGGSPWLAGASQVDFEIENLLTAYTASCPESGCSAEEQAFIQKKLSGVEVSVTPVPLPSTLWMALSALGGLALVTGAKRRSSNVALAGA
jgi:hypothetical protein